MKAGIFGIGAALPEEIVTNADLTQNLDTTDEWIVRRTGIRERRHLNGSRTLADLAAEACTMALTDAGRDAADVDRVMVCSLTPDRVMPAARAARSPSRSAATSPAPSTSTGRLRRASSTRSTTLPASSSPVARSSSSSAAPRR